MMNNGDSTSKNEETKFKDLNMMDFDKDDIEGLSTAELEKRIKYLAGMLKKCNEKEKSGKKRSIASSSSQNKSLANDLISIDKSNEESSKVFNKETKFLNNQVIDMIFPTQLKSYYASSEF